MAVSKSVGYVREKPHPPDKVRKLEEYVSLLSKHSYLLLCDVTGIPAQALHEMRRKLRLRGAELRVVKNRVFAKALEKLTGRASDRFVEQLTGQNAVIFTNENPFALILFLKKEYRMTRQAKPGDVATSDILVPAGNTGITPGPTMSLFNKLKIPIRVQEGTIWVTTDTVVAKKGEVISPELAELLGKLGLKPIEVTIPIKMILVDGKAVKLDEVELEPETYTKAIADAHGKALNLALNACLPIPEVIGLLIARARFEADALATAVVLPLPGVVERSIARAHAEATALLNAIRQRNPAI
jgi:large subunit ribosomal protein L10